MTQIDAVLRKGFVATKVYMLEHMDVCPDIIRRGSSGLVAGRITSCTAQVVLLVSSKVDLRILAQKTATELESAEAGSLNKFDVS